MLTKRNILILSISIFAVAAAFVKTSPVQADDCVTQYGGSQYGTPCAPNDLVINKEVQEIGATDSNGGPVYVENLSTSDASASAGMYMTFRLTVTNNSSQDFSTVTVKDIYPPYLSYPATVGGVSGGDVKTALYDPSTKTLTMTLEDLKSGESRQIIVTAQVDNASSFPAGQSSFCVVNTAQVSGNGRFDQDTAQVCINNSNKGTSTLPKAGSEDLLIIACSALVGIAGLALIRKTKTA